MSKRIKYTTFKTRKAPMRKARLYFPSDITEMIPYVIAFEKMNRLKPTINVTTAT